MLLFEYRKKHGLTNVEFCLLLGETTRYHKALSNVLNGNRQVPAEKALKWAEATGIHPHLLRPDIYRPEHFPHMEWEQKPQTEE